MVEYYCQFGALAQLVAHNTGSVGVRGSNPLCSTSQRETAVKSAVFLLYAVDKSEKPYTNFLSADRISRPPARSNVSFAALRSAKTQRLRTRTPHKMALSLPHKR